MFKISCFYKLGFYLLSMLFFIAIVAILGTSIPVCLDGSFVGFKYLFTEIGTIVPIVSTILFLYILIFLSFIRTRMRSTKMGPSTIVKIENVSADTMSFVASYFFPLVSFSVNEKWRHFIVLVLLFILIGLIYIKSNIYYLNPTLIVFGYKIYRVEWRIAGHKGTENNIVISRCDLSVNDNFKFIRIDHTTLYAVKS